MIKETTGKTIKYLRTKNGLNKEEFCNIFNLGGYSLVNNIARLEKIERDEAEPSKELITKLADMFDVQINDINSCESGEVWITTKKASELTGVQRDKINYHAKKNNLEYKAKNGITGRGGIYLYKKEQILEMVKRLPQKKRFVKSYKEKPEDKDYFLSKINELIDKENVKPSEVAERIGINSSTFDNYLHDNSAFNFPGKENFDLICNYFGVRPSYFRRSNLNYYSTTDLCDKWNMKMNIISPYLSNFKKEFPNSVIKKDWKFGKRNYLKEQYLDRFYEVLPDKYKGNYSAEKDSKNKNDLEVEHVDEIENCGLENKISELREITKNQSSQIRTLKRQIESMKKESDKDRKNIIRRFFDWITY